MTLCIRAINTVMLSVLMLSIANKHIMLNVVMLSIANKHIMLNVVKLTVVAPVKELSLVIRHILPM